MGTMLSHKYEVDHARTFVAIDESKSEDQKKLEYKELDELEKSIRNQQTGALTIGIAAFIIATVMLINRNKIVKRCPTQVAVAQLPDR